jgi:hypothetical protein
VPIFLRKKKKMPAAAAMERQGDARRPLPRRGQVKATIFASLFPCLTRKAAKAGERKEGKADKTKGGSSGGGSRVVPGG